MKALFQDLFAVPMAYRREFGAFMDRERIPGLWALAVVGVVFFPLFVSLDYVVFEPYLVQLSRLRVMVTIAGIAFIGVMYVLQSRRVQSRRVLERYGKTLTWIYALIYCAGLDGMMFTVGGIDTPYYAGLNLLLLGLAAAYPLQLR